MKCHDKRQFPQSCGQGSDTVHKAVHEEHLRLMNHPLIVCRPSAFLWTQHSYASTRRGSKEVLLPTEQVGKRVKRHLLSSKFELLFQVPRSPSKILFKKDYSGELYVLINVFICPYMFADVPLIADDFLTSQVIGWSHPRMVCNLQLWKVFFLPKKRRILILSSEKNWLTTHLLRHWAISPFMMQVYCFSNKQLSKLLFRRRALFTQQW